MRQIILTNYLPDVSRGTTGRRRDQAIAELVRKSAAALRAKHAGQRAWRLPDGRRIGTQRLVALACTAPTPEPADAR